MIILTTIVVALAGLAFISFLIMKFIILVALAMIAGLYFCIFLCLNFILGKEFIGASIFGSLVIGTIILWLYSKYKEENSNTQNMSQNIYLQNNKSDPSCPCGSGRTFSQCHGRRNIK